MATTEDLRTGIAPLDGAAYILDRATALLSALGTALILGVMLLIAADVTGRFFLGKPIAGVPEMVAMSIMAIVFLQIANTLAGGKLTRSDALLKMLHNRAPRLGDALDAVLHGAGAFLIWILISAFYPLFLRSYGRGQMVGTALLFAVFVTRTLALSVLAIRGRP